MELSLENINRELDQVFSFIENGKSRELEKRVQKYKENEPFKKFIQGEEYPDIEFKINENEYEEIAGFVSLINSAKESKPIDIAKTLKGNALGKFFYALAWKQGDLVKLGTLLSGMERVFNNKHNNVEKDKNNNSLVFPQFGAHLAEPAKHPIIDQHILRAYNYYNLIICEGEELTEQLLNSGNSRIAKNKSKDPNIFRFKDVDVENFLEWLDTQISKAEIDNKRDYLRTIDKCLFTLGKALNTDEIKNQLKQECTN